MSERKMTEQSGKMRKEIVNKVEEKGQMKLDSAITQTSKKQFYNAQ